MIRNDESKFFLYMEPKGTPTKPVNDALTQFIKKALSDATQGTANYSSVGEPEKFYDNGGGYKGCHHCACGEHGGNYDYLLKNGMITNDLCVHYIACHRDELSKSDRIKLAELIHFYKDNEI